MRFRAVRHAASGCRLGCGAGMEDDVLGGVADRPSAVDQPPGEVGLLHRVEVVATEPADGGEGGGTDAARATRERGHLARSVGTSSPDARDVPARRLAPLVDQPHAEHTELRVAVELLNDRRQARLAEKPGVVVEEQQDGCAGRCRPEVASLRDADVARQREVTVDEPVGQRRHRAAVPDDDPFNRDVLLGGYGAQSVRQRRQPIALGQDDRGDLRAGSQAPDCIRRTSATIVACPERKCHRANCATARERCSIASRRGNR